jgi:Alginate lyase
MSGQSIRNIVHPATTISNSQITKLSLINSTSDEVHKKGLLLLQKDVNLAYKSRAISDVDIGPSGKGKGHDEFIGDAMQILNLTLMYLCTKNNDYAKKAISLQDEWNTICKTFKGSNAPLECAWGSICMLRSIEILKYKYNDFIIHKGFQERFNSFLHRIILPNLITRYNEIMKWNNNWILTVQEALLQYYLYDNDITNANKIVSEFKGVISKCITKECGLCSETTRDLIHTQFQLGSIVQIAELCWNQGIDLYSINNNIIYKCLEYHADILNGNIPYEVKKEDIRDVWFMPCVWDIAYNHYINRVKLSNGMPHTDKLLKSKNNRPEKLTFNWGPAWIHYNSF